MQDVMQHRNFGRPSPPTYITQYFMKHLNFEDFFFQKIYAFIKKIVYYTIFHIYEDYKTGRLTFFETYLIQIILFLLFRNPTKKITFEFRLTTTSP